MYKILVSDPLAKEGLEILQSEKEFQVDTKTKLSPEELKKIIKTYHALIVRSETKVTAEIIDSAENLKVIGRAGVGIDNVDVEAASKKGIIVMNAPSGNTISTAEHTMGLILALSRNIPQSSASLREKEWERKKFKGVELYGKVLGIIGLGRIGTEVAKRAISFGMKVIAYDPFLSIDKAKEIGVELVDLKDLLSSADYITVHTPLTEETKHFIGDDEFKLMKFGVRLINCARGGIIDEAALKSAIDSGKVAGAALDVYEKEPPFESPLLLVDSVIATPHLGASTEEAQVNVAIDIAKQVRDALTGRGIRNALNVPCLEPEICSILQPYINLADKIGLLTAQLSEGRISKAQISYNGKFSGYDLTSVTVAFAKGLLTPILGETVNFVNACILAKERKISITESKSADVEDFTNLVSAQVKTDKGEVQVAGTIFIADEPRIVKINEFYVEAIPKGYMLILFNLDKPGVVGHIGTILGKNKINIAGMTFGRKKPGGEAITALNVDSPISEKIIQELKKGENIVEAKLIKL